MIRAIGFNAGMRGDLVMATVAARAFKQQFPDSHLTLAMGPQFRDLQPLFHAHPHVDATHVWSVYDGWPGERDMDYLRAANYDYTFNAFPPHTRDDWHQLRHQYAEAAAMCGLPIPQDIRPHLTRWFHVEPRPDTVALAPFGGNGQPCDKALSVRQAQDLVNLLRCMGWKVVHLGAKGEPDLEGAPRPDLCYFDSVRLMLGCHALVHCDTGLGHVAGAYGHRSFGVYGHSYYGADKVRHIQPLHEAFRAVSAPTVAGMDMERDVWPALKEHLYS